MKKTLALMLAIAIFLVTPLAALAAQPDDTRDSGVAFYRFTLSEQDLIVPYAASGSYFGDLLEGEARIYYDAMKAYFETIHRDGSGVSKLDITDAGLTMNGAVNAFSAVLAVKKDYPNLTYWLASGAGADYGVVGSDGEATCFFPIIAAYQGQKAGDLYNTDYYNVNADAIIANGNDKDAALETAGNIANAAATCANDYDKIDYFNTWICEHTSYDTAAAEPNAPYGNASQMFNVFLGQPVVCEGYAKAFKYLCDQVDINCTLVEGYLTTESGGGNHMWNYVELDGSWYIVDVTNNDGHSNRRRLLAIGTGNPFYASYDSTQSKNTSGNWELTTNAAVTLSVSDYNSIPALTVTPASNDFGNVTIGTTSAACTVTVSGTDLTDDISYSLTGDDASAFTVTETAGYTNAAGGELNIVFSPTAVQAYSASVVFSTAGADDVTLTLTGEGAEESSNNNNDNNNASTGGGGGGSGSLFGAGNSGTTTNTAVSPAAATAAVNAAIANAAAGKPAEVVFKNVTSISPKIAAQIVAAAKAAGKTATVCLDTVVDGKVVFKIYLDPVAVAKLTAPMNLRVDTSKKATAVTYKRFEKYFSNKMVVVSLGQQGAYGMPVTIAVKLDLSALNNNSLRIYSYDKASNKYYQLEAANISVDQNGYLHFTTGMGGDIIITDKPLTLR